MGIGKIFFGVMIIVIAITIYFMIMSDTLKVFVSNPGEREGIREGFRQIQALYFLVTIGLGIGIIIWGSQT